MSVSDGATDRRRICSTICRWWRTASTTLPEPASPLVRILAAPSPLRRSASPPSRALQPHHGEGARLLGDARLIGRRDVHDYAALEHLGQPHLHLPRALFHRLPFPRLGAAIIVDPPVKIHGLNLRRTAWDGGGGH